MAGDKVAGKPKPCPGCGEEPRMDPKRPAVGHRHCKPPNASPTCTWARCPVCGTVWDIETGASFHE